MHVDEPKTKELIGRLVQKMTSNAALWDDLRQEAMIHLWLTEVHRPGQTRSWYLQSCKFHLLHYLAAGRSVDSMKRRDGQMPYETQLEDQSERADLADPGACVLSFVSARELVSILSRRLMPVERAVLDCLADGLGPREIGRRLDISHTMVLKHRCKIAAMLANLENSQRPSHLMVAAPIIPPVFTAQNSRLVA